jgi:hypothetical protein
MGVQAVWSTFGFINRGLLSVRSIHGRERVVPPFLQRERIRERWLPLLVAGSRRDLASRRGLGRFPDRFLGPVVSAVSRPSRFGFIETLVLVATISFSRKLRVPRHFPPISQSLMVVVSRLNDPVLAYALWPGGCIMVRRLARGSSLLLVPVAFSFGCLCGITIVVILGLSTLFAVCPFLY